MGEVVQMDSVLLEGRGVVTKINDDGTVRASFKLVEMPKKEPTPQEQVAGRFTQQLSNIENFVIFAHTKDGKLLIFPCVDAGIGAWRLVEACRAKDTESLLQQLIPSPIKPAFA